jgi:hypothetical protein
MEVAIFPMPISALQLVSLLLHKCTPTILITITTENERSWCWCVLKCYTKFHGNLTAGLEAEMGDAEAAQ